MCTIAEFLEIQGVTDKILLKSLCDHIFKGEQFNVKIVNYSEDLQV